MAHRQPPIAKAKHLADRIVGGHDLPVGLSEQWSACVTLLNLRVVVMVQISPRAPGAFSNP